MKYIFLDFDGVINNWYQMEGVSLENVKILKQIIDLTNASVIATTSNKYSFQQRGIDYYKSIGWKRNGEIITDWKAALRSWEKQEKESNPRSKNKFNNFHQRSYDYDELEKTLVETNVREGRDKK